MKIPTEDFQSCLAAVLPLIGGRIFVPIYSYLRFAAANGQLEIQASNGEAFVLSRAKCVGDLEPIFVNAGHIKRLSASANGVIEIQAAKGRILFRAIGIADLAPVAAAEFPPFPTDKIISVGVNLIDLAEAVERVMWAGMTDTSCQRPALETVHVRLCEDAIVVEATDGKMLAQYRRAAIASKAELLIPLSYAKMIIAALRSRDAILMANENSIFIKSENLELLVPQVDAVFPSTADVVGAERKEIGALPVVDVIDHLRIMQALCRNNERRGVRFEFSKSGCEMKFQGQDKYQAHLTGSFVDAVMETRFDCLLPALMHCQSSAVVIHADEGSMAFQDGDVKTVVCLLRS